MRSCANHCIFCFVDQMPPGMRQTLYFKDDDARLSFLLGNYITLTNLTEREAQRIIDLHICPINVSVHTTDPAAALHRCWATKTPGARLDYIRAVLQGGHRHERPDRALPRLERRATSCAGPSRDLTELAVLRAARWCPWASPSTARGWPSSGPWTPTAPREIIDIAEEFGRENLRRFGTRRFFCADELYPARRAVPLPGGGLLRGLPSAGKRRGAAALPGATISSRRSEPRRSVPARLRRLHHRHRRGCGAAFCGGLVAAGHGATIPGLRGQVVAVRQRLLRPHHRRGGPAYRAGSRPPSCGGRAWGTGVLIPIHMLRHTGERVSGRLHRAQRLAEELGVPGRRWWTMDGFALADAMFAAE